MPKNTRSNISYVFVFPALVVFVLVCVYIGLGLPAARYVDRARAELKNKQETLLESQELIRGLPDPRKAIQVMEEKVREFKDMGLSKKQLPRLIQLLGKSAVELNINVISIRQRDDMRPSENSLPAGVSKVYMEVVLNCGYQPLAEYIKAVGELPAAFSLESLSVDKKNDEHRGFGKNDIPEPGIQATLLLSTYMVWEL
ncbi:MAG: type 4a pilus biogenesis protein PilO [Candidatus Omnitrophica bacterium]|jgi:Tfp pilus assembly protein PilO|nr:type 4a pilus biogenesis protein PilO [Candidatus Omnitrophota bacterium]MDD5079291.1 type 4a pilus biogenesis protein PilO [Candidatus Omnitrophota bacterium]